MILCVPTYLAYAQTTKGGTSEVKTTGGTSEVTTKVTAQIENPFKFGKTLPEFFSAILQNIVMPLGGILAVLAFVYAGFLYVTSGGNEEKIKTAHSALLYAAIGTAVLLGAVAAFKIISNTINIIRSKS